MKRGEKPRCRAFPRRWARGAQGKQIGNSRGKKLPKTTTHEQRANRANKRSHTPVPRGRCHRPGLGGAVGDAGAPSITLCLCKSPVNTAGEPEKEYKNTRIQESRFAPSARGLWWRCWSGPPAPPQSPRCVPEAAMGLCLSIASRQHRSAPGAINTETGGILWQIRPALSWAWIKIKGLIFRFGLRERFRLQKGEAVAVRGRAGQMRARTSAWGISPAGSGERELRPF